MVRRIHELREAISLYSMEQNFVEWSGMSWNNLEKLIAALEPFEEATEMLSANKSSIADVLFIGQWLKKRFEKDSSGKEFGIGTMMDVIRNGISNRFISLETNQ